MEDIGSTLREARMRARIDIIDVESATKIRAKYLRALENEEWSLLPGPTFVKSFLRTYAEYLGLDARLLVEEYKRRFERPTETELRPLSTPRPRERERGRGPVVGPPPVSRRALSILGVLALVVVGFYVIGSWGGSNNDSTPTAPASTSTQAGPATPPARAKPRRASLVLVPRGSVYVCLIGPKNRKLIPGLVLSAATPPHTYTATRMLLTVANSKIRMRVNGKLFSVPTTTVPVNYVITPSGRHRRPAGQGADCG